MSQVGKRVNESRGEALLHFVFLAKEEWTVEILRGDFTKFHGPSDPVEAQGGFGGSSEGYKPKRVER